MAVHIFSTSCYFIMTLCVFADHIFDMSSDELTSVDKIPALAFQTFEPSTQQVLFQRNILL